MAASLRSVRCAPKRSSSTLREAIDSDGLAFVINVVCTELLQPCVIHHRRWRCRPDTRHMLVRAALSGSGSVPW